MPRGKGSGKGMERGSEMGEAVVGEQSIVQGTRVVLCFENLKTLLIDFSQLLIAVFYGEDSIIL